MHFPPCVPLLTLAYGHCSVNPMSLAIAGTVIAQDDSQGKKKYSRKIPYVYTLRTLESDWVSNPLDQKVYYGF